MTEIISRSALKRRFKEHEQVAAELALLTDRDLKILPAGEELKTAINACRVLQGGARKRQIKYLAKLLRLDDLPTILDFLSTRKGSKQKENALHREAERLRDAIINEAIGEQQACQQAGNAWEPNWQGAELAAVLERYPVDPNELRGSVHQYTRTRIHNYYRETFRILKAALEKAQFSARRAADHPKK